MLAFAMDSNRPILRGLLSPADRHGQKSLYFKGLGPSPTPAGASSPCRLGSVPFAPFARDVTSDEAGADKPNCPDGGGVGSTKDTYFDSTFCADGANQRALSGDAALAQAEVEAFLPEWHQILVIVNDPERGGYGGAVAWTSHSGSDWREVAIHEMGHSAFGLADEYGYNGDNQTYGGSEPFQPNVTTESDPALVKWSALVTAGGDDPTMANADCTTTNGDPSPVAAGIVGTFEGANHWHCGLYRPVYRCMMRATSAPFCPVCTKAILDTMAPFAVPAPGGGVTLTSTTVDFNDIPEELTAVRAAKFMVESCFPVTFQLTSGPSAPFSNESPNTTVAYPSGTTPWPAYYWFRYTCNSIGAASPQVITIRCLETGEDFNVTLTGNCIPRPSVVTELVFDKSASMLDATDEGRTKEQVLRDSASIFVDLLYEDNGIGINAYDHDPHEMMPIDVAGAAGSGGGRDDALTAITGFAANPAGWTAIGDGIELAKTKLDAESGYDNKAMIVLTDGIETADKHISDVADSVINQRVFAIGMGTGEQIQPASLSLLTAGTDGYLLMTGNLSSDETFLLSKYYLQILAGVTNNEIVVDPEGLVRPGHVERIPFDVTKSDVEVTAIVLGRPAHVLQIALETPGGDTVTLANPSVLSSRTVRSVFIRAGLPLLADAEPAHAGRWHLLITIDPKYGQRLSGAARYVDNPAGFYGIRYSASVHAYSNLRMAAAVNQSSFEPGATLSVEALLTEYGAPFGGYANARVELIRPNGSTSNIALAAQGEPGAFSTDVIAASSGIYRFRIMAAGRTKSEAPFTREQIRTAVVWHRGDQSGTGGDGGGGDSGGKGGRGVDWCAFLECLLESRGIRDKLSKCDIEIDELRRCVRKICADRAPTASLNASSVDVRTLRQFLREQPK